MPEDRGDDSKRGVPIAAAPKTESTSLLCPSLDLAHIFRPQFSKALKKMTYAVEVTKIEHT